MDYKERIKNAIQQVSIKYKNKKMVQDIIGFENYDYLYACDCCVQFVSDKSNSEFSYSFKTGLLRKKNENALINKLYDYVELDNHHANLLLEATIKVIENSVLP